MSANTKNIRSMSDADLSAAIQDAQYRQFVRQDQYGWVMTAFLVAGLCAGGWIGGALFGGLAMPLSFLCPFMTAIAGGVGGFFVGATDFCVSRMAHSSRLDALDDALNQESERRSSRDKGVVLQGLSMAWQTAHLSAADAFAQSCVTADKDIKVSPPLHLRKSPPVPQTS